MRGRINHAGGKLLQICERFDVESTVYYLGTCQHVKNEGIYFAKGGDTVVQQLLLGILKERIVQLKCMFNVMKQGRPMCNYLAMEGLLHQLNLPQMPKKHWSQPLGWEFAHSMAKVCSDRLISDIAKVKYISLSADEFSKVPRLMLFNALKRSFLHM